MPEGPEVSIVIRGIVDSTSRGILSAKVSPHLQKHWVSEAILGKNIMFFRQRGKYIIVHLVDGVWLKKTLRNGTPTPIPPQSIPANKRSALVIHLGMSGLLTFDPPENLRKHAHLVINLSPSIGNSGDTTLETRSPRTLYFVDPRKFGFIRTCVCPTDLRRALTNVGPSLTQLGVGWNDPVTGIRNLCPSVAGHTRFIGRLRHHCHSNWTMKSVLMDQRAVSGFGNIYAAEALFLAGIDPRRRLGDCADRWLQTLYYESIDLFHLAEANGGSSIASFRHPDGSRGNAQSRHLVYGRSNEQCRLCQTSLETIQMDNRTTVYCPHCQK